MPIGPMIVLRALAVAAATLAPPAVASPAQAQQPRPIRAELDRFVILSGGEPLSREQTVVPDDVIFSTAVGYASAARTGNALSVEVAGVPIEAPAGVLLLEARARGGAPGDLPDGARVFCGPTLSREQLAGLERGRFRGTVRPCFVDREGDAALESAFIVGATRPADRGLIRIAPIAYDAVQNVPLPDSRADIVFLQGAALQGPVLWLRVIVEGQELELGGVRIDVGGQSQRWFPIERSVRRATYPHSIAFGAAEVAVLGYEPDGRRLRVRVEQPFETAPMSFQFLTRTIYVYH